MRERFLQNYLAFSENLNFELSKHAKGQLSSLRMTFWCLKFSKKQTQKFDEFLLKNLKRCQINKIKALSYNVKVCT